MAVFARVLLPSMYAKMPTATTPTTPPTTPPTIATVCDESLEEGEGVDVEEEVGSFELE